MGLLQWMKMTCWVVIIIHLERRRRRRRANLKTNYYANGHFYAKGTQSKDNYLEGEESLLQVDYLSLDAKVATFESPHNSTSDIIHRPYREQQLMWAIHVSTCGLYR